MMEPSTGEQLSDVFGLVANDTRFEILRALWNARTETPEDVSGPEQDPVPFARLRERVGVRDSGRFNYHLDQLVPEFVDRRGEGYVLTYAGAQAIGAAVSGIYTERDVELGTATFGHCNEPDCSGVLETEYDSGHVVVECDTCDLSITMAVPPVVAETQDVETNPEVIQQFTFTEIQRLVRGFCSLCNGPLEAEVTGSLSTDDTDGRVGITHVCQECGSVSYTTAITLVTGHPAAVSFLYDAGIDYRSIALWKQPQGIEFAETVRSEDPLRIAVTATAGDETLTLVLDEHLDVVDQRREPC
jgi:hypothetical protein